MPFITARKRNVLGFAVLCLTAAFAFLGLRAGTTDLTATATNPPLNVRENNLDGDGNIKVHEQGTVAISGTVNVGNTPATQNVRVTNTPLQVRGGTVRTYHQEFFPFDKDQNIEVDISEFSRVRMQITVNGSDSTVDFFWATDGGTDGSFSVDTGHTATVLVPEVAGTTLYIELRDPDGEQVFVNVYGTR